MKNLRQILSEAFDFKSLLNPSLFNSMDEVHNHLKLSHYYGALATHHMNISRQHSGVDPYDPDGDEIHPGDFDPVGDIAHKHYNIGNKYSNESNYHAATAHDIWQQSGASDEAWTKSYFDSRDQANAELSKVGVAPQ